jgi:hypothetical protein
VRRVAQSTDQMVMVVGYSTEVQQPMRATAVLGCHLHTHWAAPSGREQGRTASLHPDGQGKAYALATWWLVARTSPL